LNENWSSTSHFLKQLPGKFVILRIPEIIIQINNAGSDESYLDYFLIPPGIGESDMSANEITHKILPIKHQFDLDNLPFLKGPYFHPIQPHDATHWEIHSRMIYPHPNSENLEIDEPFEFLKLTVKMSLVISPLVQSEVPHGRIQLSKIPITHNTYNVLLLPWLIGKEEEKKSFNNS
jgi:hypothetical protein